jgi:hypothetical protein
VTAMQLTVLHDFGELEMPVINYGQAVSYIKESYQQLK